MDLFPAFILRTTPLFGVVALCVSIGGRARVTYHWANHHPLISRPLLNPTLRIQSFGGGVQSWTLALATERGDVGPKPDAYIMADTGDEPQAVWDYLEAHRQHLTAPLFVVKKGDILEHIRRSKNPDDRGQRVTLPYYLGDGGQMMRTCTAELKIAAVTLKIREMLGLKKGAHVPKDVLVEVWIGISMDERWRAGGFPAERWQEVRYPLIEMDLTLGGCERWLTERQFKVPPRSRCIVCPYRSDRSWRDLTPGEFEHACAVDDGLRVGGTPPRGMQSLPYLHRDRRPLRDIDLSAKPDLFETPEDDCFGVCGT